jgi:glycosyltransferase involved in cell wall biosynthesis
MRIGFDGRSLASPAAGVRRYAAELLAALARVNPADEIVVFGAPEDVALPPQARRRPVARLAPTNLGWAAIDLPRAVSGQRLDVFHAPAYTAPLHSVHPLVLTIHDVSYERHPEWYPYRRDFARRWFYRRSALSADVILTDSEFSRGEISAAYGIDASRITVAPLGVGPPFAGSRNPGSRLDSAEPYVLHVGDLHPRRNLLMLVRALTHVRSPASAGRSPLLVLAGTDRGERGMLEETARVAGVRIHFAGVADDRSLASLYSAAAVFAYPSRYEGFGLPLLEAMACGAPVIAARAGASPEVVGDAAVLVDPDDEREIASAISRVIDDVAFADRLRERGLRRAASCTWEMTAELTTRAYRAVMAT